MSSLESPSRKPRERKNTPAMTQFDVQLRGAKNAGIPVLVTLPFPTNFTEDENNSFIGHVEIVDRYMIQFSNEKGNLVWVPKQYVVIEMAGTP